MTMYTTRRVMPPHVGVPELNYVATGLSTVALAITLLQIFFNGHLRSMREVHGDFMLSGWVVSVMATCVIILLILSASRFRLYSLRDLLEPISIKFLIPLAMASTLLFVSGVSMIFEPWQYEDLDWSLY